jgi:hypothetical protein
MTNVNINTQTGNLNEDEASTTTTLVPLTGPNGVIGMQRHVVVTFNGSANQMLLYYEGTQVAQNLAADNMLELLQEDYALLGASLSAGGLYYAFNCALVPITAAILR